MTSSHDYTTQLRAALPAAYHDIAPTLVRLAGPVCASSESGGCVWFTRCGRDINDHKCIECKGTFCDVHHTTEMCTECTGQNFCLVCLSKQPCYRTGCNCPAVDFVHGYHAYYAMCISSRDTHDLPMDCGSCGTCNDKNMFACADHSFKRTYDKSKNLVAHAYNCINTDTTRHAPAPAAPQPRSSCVLQ